MKKVEINTPHNVNIQYELANVFERAIAFIIDFLIVVISSSIIVLAYEIIVEYESETFEFIIYLIPLFFYHLFSEIRYNGQSIGKRVMKIKVVKLNGEKPNSFDYVTRWAFRIIEIAFTSGSFAILNIATSQRNQRLGDLFSGMVVVKTKVEHLSDFRNISGNYNLENYTPNYPGITSLTEAEMMLIKTTLIKYQIKKSNSYKVAMEHLVKKIEEQLNITAPPDKVGFINQLIKDYVYLTR